MSTYAPDGAIERTLEIRAGEGGEDARIFVAELAQAYQKLAARNG